MFEVVVFLACRRASPEGPLGPGALARLPYTLEGVTYTFRVRAFNSVGESAPSDTGIGIECMVVIAEDGETYCQ